MPAARAAALTIAAAVRIMATTIVAPAGRGEAVPILVFRVPGSAVDISGPPAEDGRHDGG
ncbi:hypothetical protein GCM10023107_90100 [Actinoplanes octamycinicus]|nr:hypothetical protein Aoc01nite_65510 [Actinoplanes octamycinicus]